MICVAREKFNDDSQNGWQCMPSIMLEYGDEVKLE